MLIRNVTLLITMLAAVSLNLFFRSVSAQNGPVKSEEGQRVLGLIEEGDAAVSLPAKVRAGEELKLTVTTVGNGCYRPGDEGVISAGNHATVIVYDFTNEDHPGVACPKIARGFPHTVTLRFDKAGPASISIWVRRHGKDGAEDEPIVLKRRITVE